MRRTFTTIMFQVIRRFRKSGNFRPFLYFLLPCFCLLTLYLFLPTIQPPTPLPHFSHTNQLPSSPTSHAHPDTPVVNVRNVHGIPTRTTRFPGNPQCLQEPNLRLIIMTMNRAFSLQRLLNSLESAEYLPSECIALDIWVDHGPKRAGYDDVKHISRKFTWSHGVKSVHERLEPAGLYEQWIYTWENIEEHSHDIHETALILEDDLEVSPQYWRWLKEAKNRYGDNEDIAAFTLQKASLRARQIKGKFSGNLRVPEDVQAFAYLLLGTWGFAPKVRTWIRFRRWFEDMRGRGKEPYVEGLMPTDWYKSQENKEGIAPHMWSMWWIKFADMKQLFTVYANLRNKTTLAANWKEKGLHYSKGEPKKDFEIYNDKDMDIDWPKKAHPSRLGRKED